MRNQTERDPLIRCYLHVPASLLEEWDIEAERQGYPQHDKIDMMVRAMREFLERQDLQRITDELIKRQAALPGLRDAEIRIRYRDGREPSGWYAYGDTAPSDMGIRGDDPNAALMALYGVEKASVKELPTLGSLRGIASDATGDLSSEEFVRNHRDEWEQENDAAS